MAEDARKKGGGQDNLGVVSSYRGERMNAATFEEAAALLGAEGPRLRRKIELSGAKADFVQMLLGFREGLIQIASVGDFLYEGRELPRELSMPSRQGPLPPDAEQVLHTTIETLQDELVQIHSRLSHVAQRLGRRIAMFLLVRKPYRSAMEALEDILVFLQSRLGEPGELLTADEVLARMNG